MITVIVGSNVSMVTEAAQKAVAAFVSQYGDMAVERYDGEDLTAGQLESALQALPFLSEKRLVVLKNVSKQKDVAEKLQALLPDVPETTDVVIIESAPDKRTAFYKFLLKQKTVERYEALDASQLQRWLVDEAGELQAGISPSDAMYLIDRVGANQLQLGNELRKLVNYNPTISRQSIDALTERSPQSSVFELLDAAFSGNQARMLQLYAEQRAQKMEPLALIGMIGWQLHIVALVKAAKGRDPAEIARDAKLNPYVVKKTLNLVRNVTLREIRGWVDDTLQLDVDLKTKPLNADDAVQQLLLSFSASRQ
jgi:DNA polymerase-3 subunit delta